MVALDEDALGDLEPVIGGQGDGRELEFGLGGGRGRTPRQIAPERRAVREEVDHLDDVHGYQPLEPFLADVVLVILPDCFFVSPGP